MKFSTVEKCDTTGRETHTVVADMDGTLLIGRSSFPYFALVAFEAGGVLRLLFLLLASPNPRIMVEPTLKEFLGADLVLGTEIATWRGRATGLVKGAGGVLVGESKAHALRDAFGECYQPEVGLGDRHTDEPFMSLCKEGYMVPPNPSTRPVPADKLPKPIIFHDGRLVQKPTPLIALLTILWIPIGFLLACLRMAAGSLLPMPLVYHAFTLLGVRVTVAGANPPPPPSSSSGGVLFVCSHRTLLDPIFLSTALRRPTTAVVYSVSRLSELISPIKTVRLNRDRSADAAMIKSLLREGDLVICPEGTTCREPFLLRFSALFAELTDQIVPVAMVSKMGMFHGTTARGWKGMDPFYFFMNPSPAYEVTFLNKLPDELTCCGGGKSGIEVANYVQRVIAATVSFECTGFTRKDKYRALAGNDGVVVEKKKDKVMGC
ncbi:Glycerol-3-phosphate acyltransferase RAM2 [Linum perenne]